jgi:hypothetical protein
MDPGRSRCTPTLGGPARDDCAGFELDFLKRIIPASIIARPHGETGAEERAGLCAASLALIVGWAEAGQEPSLPPKFCPQRNHDFDGRWSTSAFENPTAPSRCGGRRRANGRSVCFHLRYRQRLDRKADRRLSAPFQRRRISFCPCLRQGGLERGSNGQGEFGKLRPTFDSTRGTTPRPAGMFGFFRLDQGRLQAAVVDFWNAADACSPIPSTMRPLTFPALSLAKISLIDSSG